MKLRSRSKPVWQAAAKGAFAGLAGTATLTAAMMGGGRLLADQGLLPELPPPASLDPDVQPTGRLAAQVAGGFLDQDLDSGTQMMAGQGIHWSYGTGWGLVYGVLQSKLRWPPVLGGAALGLTVATVASTVVPGLGVSPPPQRTPLSNIGFMTVMHLIFGWTIAFTYQALSRRG